MTNQWIIQKNKLGLHILLLFMFMLPISKSQANSCTYSTYNWNVNQKKAVNFKTIKKPYSQLTDREIDPFTGCTVCEEDQQIVRVRNANEIKVCKIFANDIEDMLNRAVNKGFQITELVGYRVGLTRGNIDSNGNRTQFSNHSFGIAIDVNSESNGLYDQCFEFGPYCNLRKGGEWDPNHPQSLHKDHILVRELKAFGLKWGGEIAGKQKDFMHFSPTGY